MDVFSHAAWGYGLFGQRRPCLAVAIGAMPDVMSFGIFFIIQVVTGEYKFGKPQLDTIPAWTFVMYDITHSLLIAVIAVVVVTAWRRDLGFVMLAWPFHILLDIPFHTKEFFPTKFLWPASDFVIDGVAWSAPWVWFPNIAGVLLFVAYRTYRRRSAKLQKKIEPEE